jgi:hypothetical protein
MNLFRMTAMALAVCLGPLPAGAQPAQPQLDGAVFLREDRLDGLLLSSERFEVRGTRGTFTSWSTGEGRSVRRCRLEGLVCVINEHLEIQVAADGESVRAVVRRSDGREHGTSTPMQRAW